MIEYLFGSTITGVYTFIANAMTELTFLAICVAGLIVCGFSLIFGGHDTDANTDGVEMGDGNNGDGHGPGMLSVRGLSLLAVGFGAVGYLVYHYTGKPLVASVSGLASGCLFAFLGLVMLRALLRQQSNLLIDTSAVIGATGMVVVAIPVAGRGEVTLTVQGQQISRVATTQGGAIPEGTLVRVLNSTGGVIVVEPMSAAAPTR